MQTRNKKSKGVKCNWAQRTEFIARPQQQTSSCIWEMRVFNETIFLSNYYIYVPKVFFSAMNFKRLEFGLTLFCFVNNLFRKGFWKFWKQSHSIRSTCGYQIAMFNYSELALTQICALDTPMTASCYITFKVYFFSWRLKKKILSIISVLRLERLLGVKWVAISLKSTYFS